MYLSLTLVLRGMSVFVARSREPQPPQQGIEGSVSVWLLKQ